MYPWDFWSVFPKFKSWWGIIQEGGNQSATISEKRDIGDVLTQDDIKDFAQVLGMDPTGIAADQIDNFRNANKAKRQKYG
jgi:hypothetical protein